VHLVGTLKGPYYEIEEYSCYTYVNSSTILVRGCISSKKDEYMSAPQYLQEVKAPKDICGDYSAYQKRSCSLKYSTDWNNKKKGHYSISNTYA